MSIFVQEHFYLQKSKRWFFHCSSSSFTSSTGCFVPHVRNIQWAWHWTCINYGFRNRMLEFSAGCCGWHTYRWIFRTYLWNENLLNSITCEGCSSSFSFTYWICRWKFSTIFNFWRLFYFCRIFCCDRYNLGLYDGLGDAIHGKCESNRTGFHICDGIFGLFECWNVTFERNYVVSTAIANCISVFFFAHFRSLKIQQIPKPAAFAFDVF